MVKMKPVRGRRVEGVDTGRRGGKAGKEDQVRGKGEAEDWGEEGCGETQSVDRRWGEGWVTVPSTFPRQRTGVKV
jgi:hypothetical protein